MLNYLICTDFSQIFPATHSKINKESEKTFNSYQRFIRWRPFLHNTVRCLSVEAHADDESLLELGRCLVNRPLLTARQLIGELLQPFADALLQHPHHNVCMQRVFRHKVVEPLFLITFLFQDFRDRRFVSVQAKLRIYKKQVSLGLCVTFLLLTYSRGLYKIF